MNVNKGDVLSVCVEDVSDGVLIVTFNAQDTNYKGVLLKDQCGQSTYGVNLDRISSGNSWPPLNTNFSIPNLKTIPCSVERYSYKVEGQASTLSVFQPDPTRRSHRNKPAPQLSRILRPRRFVCRKCKKTFHMEDSGVELSSTQTDQTDVRILGCHNVQNLDNESNFDQCSNASINNNNALGNPLSSQSLLSIRHVTPSIIPKLNQDLMSSNPNEVNSNSLDTGELVTSTLKTDLELPSKPSSFVDRRKRRTNLLNGSQKVKKIKLDCCKTKFASSNPNYSSNESNIENSNLTRPISNQTDEESLNSSSPVIKTKSSSTSISEVRKNRIKAQYVSVVGLPFRKSKQFSIQVADDRLNASNSTNQDVPIKLNKVRSNLRCRTTRKRDESSSTNSFKIESSKSLEDIELTNTNMNMSNNNNNGKKIGHDNSNFMDNSILKNPNENSSPNLKATSSSIVKDKHSSTKPGSSNLQNEANSTNPCSNENGLALTGRRKHVDYEKPKNRWMREAHAKRSQDERVVGSNSSTSAGSAAAAAANANALIQSSNSHLDNKHELDTSANGLITNSIQSPRLKTRSTDVSSSSTGPNSPKKIKISNSKSNQSEHEDRNSDLSPDLNLADHSSSNVPDGHTILPILKIKISRNRDTSTLSSSSSSSLSKSTTLTQYELVQPIKIDESLAENDTNTTAAIDDDDDKDKDPNISSLSSASLAKDTRLVKKCKLSNGLEFRVGDLVWSKLAGWPYWPAQITSIQSDPNESSDCFDSDSKRSFYTACLHWFAWHQVSYVPCDKLYPFVENLHRFDNNKKKRGTFRQAVNEAQQTANDQSKLLKSDAAENLSGSETTNQSESETTAIESRKPNPHLSKDINKNTTTNTSNTSSTDNDHTSLVNGGAGASSPNHQSNKSKSIVNNTKADVIIEHDPESTSYQIDQSSNEYEFNPTIDTCITSSEDASQIGLSKQSNNEEGLPNNESSGRLKIVLCPNRKTNLAKNKSNRTKDNSKPKSKKSDLTKSNSGTNSKLSKRSKRGRHECPIESDESHLPANLGSIDVPNCINGLKNQFHSDLLETECNSHNNYSLDYANSSELLTQFPHVFPDLKVSGILSDTVDIPTFSEDESEEDMGRLIIDSDVMAYVNASLDPIHDTTNNHPIPDDVCRHLYLPEKSTHFQSIDSIQPSLDSVNRYAQLPILIPNSESMMTSQSSDSFRITSDDYSLIYPSNSFANTIYTNAVARPDLNQLSAHSSTSSVSVASFNPSISNHSNYF